MRDVTDGEALLSPAITKRVIKQFARIPHPEPPLQLNELTEPELDVFRLIARPIERRDRARALHQRHHREDPHHTHPDEAQPSRPRAGGCARVRDGTVRVGLSPQLARFDPSERGGLAALGSAFAQLSTLYLWTT